MYCLATIHNVTDGNDDDRRQTDAAVYQ